MITADMIRTSTMEQLVKEVIALREELDELKNYLNVISVGGRTAKYTDDWSGEIW